MRRTGRTSTSTVAQFLSVLCLLRSTVTATVIQDSDPSIIYDKTWVLDDNGTNSNGSAHHTNMTGGTATYTFMGTAISLYGVTHIDGANFTFAIEGGPSKQCTAWRNDTGTWWFRSEICSLTGLDGGKNHTLTITHDDYTGLWAPLDYLDVIFTELPATTTSSSSSTSSTSGTTTSTSSTSSPSPPSDPSDSHKGSPNVGAIAGGVVGGCLLLATLGLLGFLLYLRNKRRRERMGTPPESTVFPTTTTSGSMHDRGMSAASYTHTHTHGGGSTAHSHSHPDHGHGYTMSTGSTNSAFPVSSPTTGGPSTAFYPHSTTDIMSSGVDSPTSYFPTQSLPSHIERSGGGASSSSLYPAGVASYALPGSGGRGPAYQPLALHDHDEEDEDAELSASASRHIPTTSLSSGVVTTQNDGLTSNEIERWRSEMGSPPPPSYRTGPAND